MLDFGVVNFRRAVEERATYKTCPAGIVGVLDVGAGDDNSADPVSGVSTRAAAGVVCGIVLGAEDAEISNPILRVLLSAVADGSSIVSSPEINKPSSECIRCRGDPGRPGDVSLS